MRHQKELLVSVASGFLLPVALYYTCRVAGADQITALLIGSAPALAQTAYTIVRRRLIDKISLFTLSLLFAGALASLITGSPRALLARGSVFTALIGIWLLWSLRGRTIAFEGIIMFQKSSDALNAWEANWRDSPEFRHVMRAVTIIWGVGFLLEAAIRFVLAYTLPVDSVPLVTSVQFMGLIVAMLWVAPRYGRWYMARQGISTGPNGITAVRSTQVRDE